MYSRKSFAIVVAILGTLMFITVVRADQVDSPQYQSWAKCKVGTTVNYDMQMAGGPMQMSQTVVYTLKDIAPDKVTIQIDSTMNMGGMSRPMPPQTVAYPAKVEKGQEYAPANFTGTVKEDGKETIDIAGKKYECRVFEFSGESSSAGRAGSPPLAATGKIWNSADIPGGMAKMQMDGKTDQMTINITTTMTSFTTK